MSWPSTDTDANARKWPTVSSGTMPTTTHSSTRNSTGKRIQRGGSCGFFGRSSGSGPKKTLMKRSE